MQSLSPQCTLKEALTTFYDLHHPRPSLVALSHSAAAATSTTTAAAATTANSQNKSSSSSSIDGKSNSNIVLSEDHSTTALHLDERTLTATNSTTIPSTPSPLSSPTPTSTATPTTATTVNASKDELDGKHVADFLEELNVKLDARSLLSHLRPLVPRLYSISSSTLADPHHVR